MGKLSTYTHVDSNFLDVRYAQISFAMGVHVGSLVIITAWHNTFLALDMYSVVTESTSGAFPSCHVLLYKHRLSTLLRLQTANVVLIPGQSRRGSRNSGIELLVLQVFGWVTYCLGAVGFLFFFKPFPN